MLINSVQNGNNHWDYYLWFCTCFHQQTSRRDTTLVLWRALRLQYFTFSRYQAGEKVWNSAAVNHHKQSGKAWLWAVLETSNCNTFSRLLIRRRACGTFSTQQGSSLLLTLSQLYFYHFTVLHCDIRRITTSPHLCLLIRNITRPWEPLPRLRVSRGHTEFSV